MTSSKSVREIAFPDPTAEGFDPSVPFQAPNGTSYLWNGWGWDVVPKGVGGDGGSSEPDPRLPYLIETDKVTRKTKEVRDQGPEIDLVDAEGNYSNVKFEASNGVVVSSTPSSIVIDGTEEQEAREAADNALNELISQQAEQFEQDQERQDDAIKEAAKLWANDDPPPDDSYDFWFCTKERDLTLYVPMGEEWIPASPPVSMDGVAENSDAIVELTAAVQRIDNTTATLQSGLTNTVIKTDAALNDITDRLGKVTLEEAVNNGNVAKKPIAVETENGVSVVEDQCVRITHRENPYIRLTDVVDQDSLEITLDDDHGHINLTDQKDELHFKFGGKEKVVFKGEGDAEFKGRVTVDPGHEGHEVVTVQQLQEVEQQIEDIAPALDQGEWTYQTEKGDPGNGYYSLAVYVNMDYCQAVYKDCLAVSDGPEGNSACNREYNECIAPDNQNNEILDCGWVYVEYVTVNTHDSENHNHPFPADLVKPGHFIEVLNVEGDGFGLYEVVAKIGSSQKCRTWQVKHKNSRGIPDGLAKFRWFTPPVDPADYYTKAEIDEKLGGKDGVADGPDAPILDSQDGLLKTHWWTYSNDFRQELASGAFVADDGEFFLNEKNSDNQAWAPRSLGTRSCSSFVTIVSKTGQLMHTYKITAMHFGEKYHKKYIVDFRFDWHHVSHSLVLGEEYRIIVPGFLS